MIQRSRSWPVVAAASAVLLLLTLLGCGITIRYVGKVAADFDRIERERVEGGRLLDDLRSQTYVLAIELRDYLPSSANAASLERVHLAHQRILTSADRLKLMFPDDAQGTTARLQQDLNQYWMSMEPVFGWAPARKLKEAPEFLRQNVAPNRSAVLTTMNRIEALREVAAKDQYAALARTQEAFRRSLSLGLSVLVGLGVIVATITWRKLRTLEERGLTLQLQTEQDREALRELSQKLVRAQEEERRFISRELHDQIGQMLTAIQMQFTNIEVSTDSPSDIAHHLKNGQTLVDQAVHAVRHIAMGLRPSILDDLGLTPALEWQAREFTRHSGIPVSLKIDGEIDALSDLHRTFIYRIVQEALTNCGRHAEAHQVSVILRGVKNGVSLIVQDDGKGFDPQHLVKRGLGLVGMEERVRELGGRMTIVSEIGTGTLIDIEVPVRPTAPGEGNTWTRSELL